jgi:protein-disulfide isomerase
MIGHTRRFPAPGVRKGVCFVANGFMNRRILAAIVAVALLAAGFATARVLAQGLTSAQGEAILSELKEIRRLLEQMQKQFAAVAAERPAPAADATVKVPIGDGHRLGSATAPLVMIEFTDYQCPYCRNFAVSTFPGLKAKYIDTGKLEFVSRDFPLDFHPQALIAAHAARCAGDQGKYWQIRPVLFAHDSALQKDDLLKYARDLGLNTATFQQCLDKETHAASIKADLSEALAVGIEGTPTFVLGRRSPSGVIDGIRIVGAQPIGAFDARIAELLAEK